MYSLNVSLTLFDSASNHVCLLPTPVVNKLRHGQLIITL